MTVKQFPVNYMIVELISWSFELWVISLELKEDVIFF